MCGIETLEEMADGGTDLEEDQAVADGQCPVDGTVPPAQESFSETRRRGGATGPEDGAGDGE